MRSDSPARVTFRSALCLVRLQELSNYLLQLVQALRYETKYPSDLSECAQPALLTQQVG